MCIVKKITCQIRSVIRIMQSFVSNGVLRVTQILYLILPDSLEPMVVRTSHG